MDISRLSRLVAGVQREVDLTQNTLVLQNLKVNLSTAFNFTFAGTLTANRTITMPDANVNLGHIASLYALSGVTAGAENLGTFTGTTIPDSSTIKDALQALETAVESISISPQFSDADFRIQDDGDPTKQIGFEAQNIAPGATRNITMPDQDVDLALIFTSLQTDGSNSPTADISWGNYKIADLGAPTLDNDAATKVYVDNAIEGVKPKEAVQAATTANITLSGLQTVDGVSLVANDRVLVKDQTLPEENGIYLVAAGAWTRSTDFDELTPINEIRGSYVAVSSGTTNAGKVFVCNSNPTTLDVDPITFVFFNSIATINAGDGIDLTGTTLSVDHDGEGLTFVSGQLALELDGSTLSKSASGLRVATSGITDNELASNSVTTAKIANAAVDSDKLAASVAGAGLTGGAGSPLAVGNTDGTISISADAISVAYSQIAARNFPAGESFAANLTWIVRLAVDGETAGRVYKADNDAATEDNFYVIGIIEASPVALSAGDTARVTFSGVVTLGLSDITLTSADLGKPVYLGANGAFTLTPPSAANTAVVRVGVVFTTTQILVQPMQVNGIN